MDKDEIELKDIELSFREKVDRNNVFLTGSIAYFFLILFTVLVTGIETSYGIILLLTAIMLFWGVIDMRKRSISEYDKKIKELINRCSNK